MKNYRLVYLIVCCAWLMPQAWAAENPGIKEEIPFKYQNEYQAWKKEFLTTEIGRRQWAEFAGHTEFVLTIKLNRDNSRGASTGEYKWNAQGRLVAATISLGSRLNEGFPNPIYYPVMNSLALPDTSSYQISREMLAATKLAHEFGHLLNTAGADAVRFQLQSELIPVYNKIFLSNGRKTTDPLLQDLARRIGGTPVEIWEDREYWGEANAMRFLGERLAENGVRCTVFSQIKRSVDLYAKNYSDRFFQAASTGCDWK